MLTSNSSFSPVFNRCHISNYCIICIFEDLRPIYLNYLPWQIKVSLWWFNSSTGGAIIGKTADRCCWKSTKVIVSLSAYFNKVLSYLINATFYFIITIKLDPPFSLTMIIFFDNFRIKGSLFNICTIPIPPIPPCTFTCRPSNWTTRSLWLW